MEKTRIALAAAALMMASSASAGAQADGRFTLPKQPPRQATQPRATQRPATAPGVYPGHPAYPVAYTLLPAVVMSDGRVFADFGYGYEPVARACAVPVHTTYTTYAPYTPIVSSSTTGSVPVIAGNGVVLSSGMQAPPVQTTQSQLNLPSVQAALRQQQLQPQLQQHVVVSSPAHSACYRHDATGPVVIVR